jgi:hypothetical protein
VIDFSISILCCALDSSHLLNYVRGSVYYIILLFLLALDVLFI